MLPAAAEGFFSKRWIADNLFNISEEEFLRNQTEFAYDKIKQAEFDVLDQQMQAKVQAGMSGGLRRRRPFGTRRGYRRR